MLDNRSRKSRNGALSSSSLGWAEMLPLTRCFCFRDSPVQIPPANLHGEGEKCQRNLLNPKVLHGDLDFNPEMGKTSGWKGKNLNLSTPLHRVWIMCQGIRIPNTPSKLDFFFFFCQDHSKPNWNQEKNHISNIMVSPFGESLETNSVSTNWN